MAKPNGIFANLPETLDYLIEPAMKYGVFQFDHDIDGFFQNASEDSLEELASVAERIRLNDHSELIENFLDRFPIGEHPESAKLYFLLHLVDAAGLEFQDDSWNTVEKRIASLGMFGSMRLASKRMWAARFLADLGGQGRSAIPQLHTALGDEDFRVRVWAHFALAVLEGAAPEHEHAVQEIFALHNSKDDLDCYDDVGMEAVEALEKFRELHGAECVKSG